MALDPTAQALMDEMAAAMPAAMSGVPIADLRAATAAQPPEQGPDMHAVVDVTVPRGDAQLAMRLYRPTADPNAPIVLWLHGGGFAIGSIEMYDGLCRDLAALSGATIASLGYRLAPEHPFPVPVEDAYAGLLWLAEHGAEHGDGDPSRLIVGGDSAGGTLAMVVAQLARDREGPAIELQIAVYGTAELRVSNPELGDLPILRTADCEWFWEMYAPDPASRKSPRCSPALAPDLTGLPSAFVLTAEHDPTRDGAEAYAHRLAASGVRTTLRRVPGTFHGFLSIPTLDAARAARREVGAAIAGSGGPAAAGGPDPGGQGEPGAV